MNQPDSVSPDDDLTIRLDDFLKISGVVATGGEAKICIQGGEVTVNGEVETRRRKQLVVGDIVEFRGEQIEVSTE
jgi:ribosome-associated protein